jgi:putative GTP pyrophosphokinase
MGSPSKTTVNRAGDVVRSILVGAHPFAEQEVDDALLTIVRHRARHALPLQRVAVNLRYYVQKHSLARPIFVGQRLKRLPTIIDKLEREPKMHLSRMHDIGGCRAVVKDEAEARAVVTHLRRRWSGVTARGATIVREYDYIENPKPVSGYRALHLVVAKDSCLIEVQVRTGVQHAWAELIETVDRRNPDLSLKGGQAPADLIEYYRVGAGLLEARERGEAPNAEVLLRFRELHEKVRPYTGTAIPSP